MDSSSFHEPRISDAAIEYQAAMLRDELEESSGWTTVGIARLMNEAQARDAIAAQAH